MSEVKNNISSSRMLEEQFSLPKINKNLREFHAKYHQDNKMSFSYYDYNNQEPKVFSYERRNYDDENYFYKYEPPLYVQNYDNSSSVCAEKCNMKSECSTGKLSSQNINMPISKVHVSTCNLNNQFSSSNLMNSHNFSNSLNNFNMMNKHLQNYYNYNSSFTQLPQNVTHFGSSSLIDSSFASNISLNGTPKNSNMPWKHRQCSSSSSGTNSSSKSNQYIDL
jgi:hypothetical protein